MARDYRYGHKTSQTTQRRSQLSDDASPRQERANETPRVGRDRQTTQSTDASISRATKTSTHTRTRSEKVMAAASATRRVRYGATTPAAATDDLQKIKSEAYLSALPKHIRKEMLAQEALTKAQAEQAETERLQQQVQRVEKRRTRLSLGVWVGITAATIIGALWLLYAPFFLAFAVEMGWVNDATRVQLDPAAAMRSELVAKKVDAPLPAKTAPVVTAATAESDGVNYSFYNELPKDVVQLGVQPLPVRTHAPMYLQLSSFPNDKEAQIERRRIMQKGYMVQMAPQNGKSGLNYVLRMGPYDDQRTLNRLKVELQKLGVDAHEVSLASVIKASEPAPAASNGTSVMNVNSRGAVAH